MLLRYAHIMKSFGKMLLKKFKPGTVRHSCGNGNHILISFSDFNYLFCKYIRIVLIRLLLFSYSRNLIKGGYSMEFLGIIFRRLITLTLFCNYMNYNRMIKFLRLGKYLAQLVDIMSVYRSEVSYSHIFKKHTGYNKLLDTRLCLSYTFYKTFSDIRYFFKIVVYKGF